MEFGCSSFTWDTRDGKHFLGRTYDQMGDLSGNRIVRIPAGDRMATILGDTGEDATTRYSFTGMAITGLRAPIVVDGVNEKGLMGALLNFPGYNIGEEFSGPGGKRVHPGFLVGYLLGTAGSVAEACREMESVRLADEEIFGEHMSVHYLFSDRTGEAVVMEPGEGGIRIHRDTIGVMTNSPDYLWHKTNLRNYRGALGNGEKQNFLGGKLEGFGELLGSGYGLPGDYSSPSRFARLAVLKELSVKGKNEVDGVSRMFQIFSSVDTPEGILWEDRAQKKYEMTLCTSVMCAESGIYYFAVRENQRICAVRPCSGMYSFELPKTQDIDYWN